jgi:cyclic pyranopterin phosphate synthase
MYLRVSVTDRCNLRCTYCLPERATFARGGATAAELHALVAAVVEAAGARKIRLTGGEPTLDPDLVEHVRLARSLVPDVGLTTNGVRLAPLLPALRAAGLRRLNVSLDAASASAFAEVTRRQGFEAVLAAIRAARELGFSSLKVNCVATRRTDAARLVELARREGFHLRFIELMAIGEARHTWSEQFVSATELRSRLSAAGHTLTERSDLDEPTSRIWTLPGEDPERTTVGFITTVTAPFCDTCNRLRLTRQGRLHFCLFDAVGADLLGPLRESGLVAVKARVQEVIAAKRPPEAFTRTAVMAAIGG